MARRRDPNKAIKALGLRIRKLRNERGWTLEECEERGWQNWRHLQQIEAGKNITFLTILNLAHLFGVQPAAILEDI